MKNRLICYLILIVSLAYFLGEPVSNHSTNSQWKSIEAKFSCTNQNAKNHYLMAYTFKKNDSELYEYHTKEFQKELSRCKPIK